MHGQGQGHMASEFPVYLIRYFAVELKTDDTIALDLVYSMSEPDF